MRIDKLLVEKGLAESRTQAQKLVMAGVVNVNGQRVPKPSNMFSPDSSIDLERGPRFVSRGGEKLQAAFENFNLNVDGLVCADVGASSGGFTDCLLQHGASRVFAIDVGKGILHWKLRNDPRVVIMEETNARYINSLSNKISFVTMDASFISLKVLLPVVKKWLESKDLVTEESKPGNLCGQVVALIKPQFEAGRKQTAKGKGVIRDSAIHLQVIEDLLTFARNNGFTIHGLIKSPLLGPKGNIEFLTWMKLETETGLGGMDIRKLITTVFENNT